MTNNDCCEWCRKSATVTYYHLLDTYDMCNDCASENKLVWISSMLGTYKRW